MKVMRFFLFALLLLSVNSVAQIPSNEEATDALLAVGEMSVNYPLYEVYQPPSREDAYILEQLKRNYMISYKVIANNTAVFVEKKYALDDFITSVDRNNRMYMVACAIAAPLKVVEVRYHQSKRSVFIFKCNLKIVDQSKFGRVIGRYPKGEFYTLEIEFEQTSNGWRLAPTGNSFSLISRPNTSRYGMSQKTY